LSPVWRKRLTLPLLILTGLNVLVFMALTLPRLIQERSLVSREAVLSEEVKLQSERAAAASQRIAILKANAAEGGRFVQQVVGNRRTDLVPVLQELAQTAEGLGLRLERQGYDRDQIKGLPVEQFRITLPLVGTYAQLSAFVAELERAPRFLTVDRIALNDDVDAGRARMNVVVSAYFRTGDEAR
jgi:Tfp pilus assembly protein PilO